MAVGHGFLSGCSRAALACGHVRVAGLAKRRDGQNLINAMRQVIREGDVRLPVPVLVIEESGRNRERIEQSTTTSVADRFRLLHKYLEALTAESYRTAFDAINARRRPTGPVAT